MSFFFFSLIITFSEVFQVVLTFCLGFFFCFIRWFNLAVVGSTKSRIILTQRTRFSRSVIASIYQMF